MRCFYRTPVTDRACPWLVEKRVSVKLGTAEIAAWDCCGGHVRDANQLALEMIHKDGRGTWHTDRYEQSLTFGKPSNDTVPYRPYLSIDDEVLKRDMIIEQQSTKPRVSMNQWIIEAIRQRIERSK